MSQHGRDEERAAHRRIFSRPRWCRRKQNPPPIDSACRRNATTTTARCVLRRIGEHHLQLSVVDFHSRGEARRFMTLTSAPPVQSFERVRVLASPSSSHAVRRRCHTRRGGCLRRRRWSAPMLRQCRRRYWDCRQTRPGTWLAPRELPLQCCRDRSFETFVVGAHARAIGRDSMPSTLPSMIAAAQFSTNPPCTIDARPVSPCC